MREESDRTATKGEIVHGRRSVVLAIAGLVLLGAAAPAMAAEGDGYGGLAGTFTRGPGHPIGSAGVELDDPNGNQVDFTATDAEGKYRFDHVTAGQYKVRYHWPENAEQWYPRQTDPYQAKLVEVTAGADTVVDETALPTGSAEFTVTDEQTQAAVPGACVSASGVGQWANACADSTGTVRFDVLRTGAYQFRVGAAGHLDDVINAEVRADETLKLASKLPQQAKVTVTFTDAATGAPVGRGCVAIVDPTKHSSVSTSDMACTYGSGQVQMDYLWPGKYRFFAVPGDVANGDGVHGSQWVGARGGTGDVDQATWFEVKAGQPTDVRVKFDAAGSITGKVTDAATGAAVSQLCPTVTSAWSGGNQPWGVRCTSTDGRYTIDGVGPYDWRVQFPDETGAHAWTWSGGGSDRLAARPVRVKAGSATTLDAALKPAGKITGKVLGVAPPVQWFSVNAYSSRTGEPAGPDGSVTAEGRYTLAGLATQNVRIEYYHLADGPLEYPRPVSVVTGRETSGIDLRVPANR
ncbi:carboxypeptidase regulatory-like domain-containing protein [Amycolatopsis rhabdoformis]|uniref:Carboxypeptidase regulatory-like domain-containing protein n=1 Tax=Amycolatopsis rhabdoformis TaxID=1448059 RepID=A0ABZ1IE26_9PSEU|nr:carboxypeptidase regulatory-like domain-containing protein [Amycolatopsis rhabdoformis]WSE31804.1 carboxypeptidase regulatory-like domain-containing protein [Amycolatopsis rhabdoformis]